MVTLLLLLDPSVIKEKVLPLLKISHLQSRFVLTLLENS
jgi:hypothetical protein